MDEFRATTILCVQRNGNTVMAGDGQVTQGDSIIKTGARKVRKLYDGRVLAGFAGSAADAFTLFEKFESRIKDHEGNLTRAVVELARDWRSDKFLRRLEAMMMVADDKSIYLISGSGDVIAPDGIADGAVMAIGSGAVAARAAATALISETALSAFKIAEKALLIASSICIYTNDSIVIESFEDSDK
jgi:ATP-dependent HslUV protease subunit HslV